MQIVIPGLTVEKLVSACILVNAYTTYPCLILVIQVTQAYTMPTCHHMPTELCCGELPAGLTTTVSTVPHNVDNLAEK